MSFQVDGEKIPVAREGELYSLKWHTFQSHLTSGLKQFLFEEDFLTDVTLVAEGRTLRSHRMLLSLCSPHFKQLFQGFASAPNSNTIVILNNVRFQDLQHVIQFIYNGEVKVSNNHELQGFLQTGELLQIEGLTKTGPNNIETDGQEQSGRSSPPSAQTHRRSQATSSAKTSAGSTRVGSQIPTTKLLQDDISAQINTKPVMSMPPPPAPPQSSHQSHGQPPPIKRTRFGPPSATVTSATYNDNTNSITGDLNNVGEGSEMDPLALSGISSTGEVPGLMDASAADQEVFDEEQMITIDSIKSEAVVEGLYVHGDNGSDDDDGTFEMTEHVDPSVMGVDGMYHGAVEVGDDSLNVAGPSSAVAGASTGLTGSAHRPSKPPGEPGRVKGKKCDYSKQEHTDDESSKGHGTGRVKSSIVYKYFRDNETHNFCTLCPQTYKKQSRGCTSGMKRHLMRKHSDVL